MSPQRLKKALQKDLRAKRNKSHRSLYVGLLLLAAVLAGGGYLWWNQQRPATLLQQGIKLEQQDRLEPALECYARLSKRYAGTKQAAEALYRSGRILQHDLGRYQRALISYLQLEKDYPHSGFVIPAQREAAELTKFRLGDCRQAIPVYQRLVEQAGERGDRYLYEIADCYVRLENWSQAAIEFEALLGSYPKSDRRALVTYRLADAWLLSNQRQKAREEFITLVKTYPDSALAQEARFRLAEMLEEEEHLKEALKAYSALTDYPRQELLKQKILQLKKRMARKKKVL